MRFLLDQDVPEDLSYLLRELGHDVVRVRDVDYFDAARLDNWSDMALDGGVAWKSDLADLAEEPNWLSLRPGERFAVLPQAGSMLRSSW